MQEKLEKFVSASVKIQNYIRNNYSNSKRSRQLWQQDIFITFPVFSFVKMSKMIVPEDKNVFQNRFFFPIWKIIFSKVNTTMKQ